VLLRSKNALFIFKSYVPRCLLDIFLDYQKKFFQFAPYVNTGCFTSF
jgi:hypothetical protein